jgi:hypothetical protein
MPRNRFYAVANSSKDNHDSVNRAVKKLMSVLAGDTDCRATIIVPSLDAIDNTVVPQVLNELDMGVLISARKYTGDNFTLTLCGERTLARGHGNNHAYLVVSPTVMCINAVEAIQAWSTLIVVASEEITIAWRGGHKVEKI